MVGAKFQNSLQVTKNASGNGCLNAYEHKSRQTNCLMLHPKPCLRNLFFEIPLTEFAPNSVF